jgi:endonuclease YncB( thermonuclease family)
MTKFFIALVLSWSVVDGDTIRFSGRVWPGVVVEERVRLVRIDAPETKASQACERAMAQQATKWLGTTLSNARVIEVRANDRDGFGRILGDVIVDGVSVSDMGLKAGVLRPYSERVARKAWCTD